MRIAYLHDGSIPAEHAAGVRAVRMCDAMVDAGHQVILYARPGSVPADDLYAYYGTRNRFEVRVLPQPAVPLLGPWLRARRVRAELRRRAEPDLLYGDDRLALLACAAVAPMVQETDRVPTARFDRALERRLLRRRRLHRVVAASRTLAEELLAAFPYPPARSTGTAAVTPAVTPAAAPTTTPAPDPAAPPRTPDTRGPGRELPGPDLITALPGADPVLPDGPAAELPGRAGALRIGVVGGLSAGRGTGLLLALADRLPEADFHLVGGTEAEVRHWRDRCRSVNVHFHGHCPPAQVTRYLRAFDLVLAPHQQLADGAARRTVPTALAEYLAHGRAVIASDHPLLRELLTDEVDSLLCPPDAVEDWIKAVRRLTEDPELRERLATNALRGHLTHHTWQARAARVLAGLPTDHRPWR
ncbi:glycosyltransferase family 4 protein [Kitasatospora sp. NPDC096147]|uniref:glycosyltransferase family 4 protein n=1 Tax=Kitasatospora sp. NPDC096147 TaxID=3364093 RepID=UPI0037FFB9D8